MITFLLIALVALQLADIVTTYRCLMRGKGAEGNPVLIYLFNKLGVLPVLITTKGLFSLWAVGATCLLPGAYESRYWAGLLLILVAAYMWVIFNNLQVLKGKKQ